ncbi:amidohydrolase family protein [Sphingomonas sabuli]|uniref:Amidohydrolase family protein n=1 Tax=Sphingomonas sabuli TaxID=2764186 RepID=A0A7G9L2Y5_9SPHN|nr:amidohydrolase family protein [Sphingomonas sabuli]QNM82984.1 amidohydrolase family protein [Sphingomonas sabuli]
MASPAWGQDMVLSGATLVNPADGSQQRDSVIVVRDGRIETVGTAARNRLPKDLPVVDAKGKWVVPGYVDAHVHFFQSGGLYARPDGFDLQAVRPYQQEVSATRADVPDTFARYLASGITAVADVGGPMENFAIRAQAEGNDRAPRVAVAGPLISTRKPAVLGEAADPPIIAAKTAEEARALVRAQTAKRPDFVKIWFLVQPDETAAQHLPVVSAAIDEAHKAGVRVAVHATELETARAAVVAGADILVHGVEDKPVDDAFLALLKRRGTLYSTTLDVYDGYMRTLTRRHAFTAQEYALGDPEVMGTLLEVAAMPDTPATKPLRALAGKPIPDEPRRTLQANLKRVRDAGIPIVTGTDAGNVGTLPGPSIYREFARMAEAGLTPREILFSTTAGGARLMGWQDRIGTIAPGKLADMVVLDADPLADSANLSRIAMVIKGGKAWRQHELVPQSAAEVVQRQVNAYNSHDIDAFLATYAPDARIMDFPAKPQMQGRDMMRKVYSDMFTRLPALRVSIPRRSVIGNMVIDEEVLSGMPGMDGERAVAIYEVDGGLIRNVTFITPPPPAKDAAAKP